MALPAYNAPTKGVTCPTNLYEAAMRNLAGDRRLVYESHEFLLPSPVTNWSLKNDLNHAVDCSCQRASGFGGIIKRAGRSAIRNIGAGIVTFKYNQPDEDPISLEDGEKEDWDFTEIEDILFTNVGGSAVGLRVLVA
jgi:hypothetical protein